MQASTSQDDLADFAIFRCLTCDTTIREAKPRKRRATTRITGDQG
jgi:hypothetical protein